MLSIVVIEYKSVDDITIFIKKAKEALIKVDYELIVSSNSLYCKEEKDKIIEQFPDVRWIFNEKNGGFAYGMNEGLRIAQGDVLAIMNPDVKIITSLDLMMDYLNNHHEVGIIAPKIIDEDGVIQDSFRHYITPWRFIARHIDRIKNHNKLNVAELKEPVNGDWVIGAFMMCRRDFYEKVGGLCDDYFMYCEDMDWCKRAHLCGYEVVYFPDSIIEYKGTRSARRSLKYTMVFLKSLFTYWKKFGFK